jgi:hypothetical protein
MAIYIFVLTVGLAAGAVSGIIGTGASIMLLPVLVFQFGPKQAVPIMAIAALMSNVGKVLAWWREVDWRAFAAYSATGIPAAALGAPTLLVLPSRVVDLALGLFFLAMIPGRRRLQAMSLRLRLWQLGSPAPSSASSPASSSRPGRSASRPSPATASRRAPFSRPRRQARLP